MTTIVDRAYRAKDKLERTIRRMQDMEDKLFLLILVAEGAQVQEMTQAQAIQRLTTMVEGLERSPEP